MELVNPAARCALVGEVGVLALIMDIPRAKGAAARVSVTINALDELADLTVCLLVAPKYIINKQNTIRSTSR